MKLWNGESGRRIIQAAQDFTGQYPFESTSQIFIGLSGGPDSLALTAAMAKIHQNIGSEHCLQAIIVDHQLQENSHEFSEHARNQAGQLGVNARVVRVKVEHRDGLEADARKARYDALQQVAQGAPIVIGHTLDDQAETVLLGLARGSGPRSLSGMPKVRGNIYRPLLGARRKDTLGACREWGLDPVLDMHNFDPGFLRSKLRGTIMPLLSSELHDNIAENLARSAVLLAEDTAVLDNLADDIVNHTETSQGLPIASLQGLPKALRTRVIRLWLYRLGYRVQYSQLDDIDTLVHNYRGQGGVAINKPSDDQRTEKQQRTQRTQRPQRFSVFRVKIDKVPYLIVR